MAAAAQPNADDRVAQLQPLMRDADPRVRKSCVVALGRMDADAAGQLLCDALNDVDEGVRVLACQALGRKTGAVCARALPALLAHVHDGSREVRSGILWALANAAAHGDLTDAQREALFTPVMVMAFDPEDGVRADAAAVLGALRDDRAPEGLSVLLEDECPRVRANACVSLGLCSSGLDAVLACAANASEDVLVRVSAVDALARAAERGGLDAGTVAAAAGLCCDLAQEGAPAVDADLAATAVWALGLFVPACPDLRGRAQALLASALAGDAEWPARYAAEALARIHDDDAYQALRAAREAAEGDPRPFAEALASVVGQALGTFE